MEQVSEVGTRLRKSRLVTTMTLGFILFGAQLFVLINLAYWGESLPWQTCVLYMLIPVGFIVYSSRTRAAVESINLMRATRNAAIGFMLTYLVVLLFYGYILKFEFGTTPRSVLYSTILLQVLFVAPSEELAFRLIIPNYLLTLFKKHYWFVALVLAQAGFALFHLSAYGGNLGSMAIAFVIGMIWVFAMRVKFAGKELGIGFTIGSHAAYNLILTGVLVGNVSMICGG
ncbi:MAG: hypothetical protein PHG80_10950 [Methanoregulaceae archaeon]|nr:hypothetical protein [Methanoregulaceae archaeon]